MNYITRSETGILVSKKQDIVLTKGLKQYINELCEKDLSTFDGRRKAVRNVINCKSLIPIFVNKRMILFPTKPLRDLSCVFVNYNYILSVVKVTKGKSKIIFYDLTELELDISSNKLTKQLEKCKQILDYKKN